MVHLGTVTARFSPMKLSSLLSQLKTGDEKIRGDSRIDLFSVTLDAEEIRNAVFESAIFDRVTFAELALINCDLTASHFFACTFVRCRFIDSTFHKSEFHNSKAELIKFANCSFTKTEWYGGDFRHAVVAECDFSWSYLQSVDFRYAEFKDVNLAGALWHKTKVYKSRFDSINFGSRHPARVLETDITELADGTSEVSLEQFRHLFGL